MADKQRVVRPRNTINLDDDIQNQLANLRGIDLIIGIPSHRNGRTIGEVLQAINQGVSQFYRQQRILLLNPDGGSSDNTTQIVLETPMPGNVDKIVTTYSGSIGKGSAVRAIFEASRIVQARACLVVDAHVPGINPEWLPGLIEPIINDRYDLTLGAYQRSSYAAAFNDNVVYPFLRAFLASDLRNPLASEFCISGEYATELASQDIWETDVARFGINIRIAMESILTHRRLVQVELGYRGDPSGEPGGMADPRLLHVLSSLFRFLTTHHRLWSMPVPTLQSPVIPFTQMSEIPSSTGNIPDLLAAFKSGAKTYRREWDQVLSTRDITTIRQLADLPAGSCVFPLDLWIRVLLRFAFVYNCGEGDPDKVAEAFLPLFYLKAADYIRQTSALTLSEREQHVESVVAAMIEAKPAFVTVWRDRPIWMDPSWF
ncbi:MAG: glycosyltransferase family protein [Anaerolineae bacterium]